MKGDDGQDFGTGYFNPKSLIAVRLLARECGAAVDAAFFAARLKRARWRCARRFYRQPFYRLVHAEGDGLPGLTIDRFGDIAGGADHHRGHGSAADAADHGAGQAARARQPSSCATTRRRARWKGWTLYVRAEKGAAGRIAVEENGARYFADLGQGQKTGWYYDQRDNRAFIAGLAQGQVRCSTPIPIPAASASWRPRRARRK